LNRKGKALGLLWMNVGEVSWGEVPDVYLVQASDALGKMAGPDALQALGVGLDAVRATSSPGDGADALFDQLALLKAREGLWGVGEGGVDIRAVGDGSEVAAADFALPVRAPPGVYRIQAYAFVDGRGARIGSGEVRVTQGSLPAFISDLAAEHGLIYGILAVAVAVAVGLLTGVVFGLGSKGGH